MTKLFHSTPYPQAIEADGLRPFFNHTQAMDFGAFVFATQSEIQSLLYAFKLNGVFPERSLALGTLRDEDEDMLGLMVVGKAEPYLEALKGVTPTRFEITNTLPFKKMVRPNGYQTTEWISEKAVHASGLIAERVSLSQLAGKAEIFEVVGDRTISINEEYGGIMPAYEAGAIRSVSTLFGVRPVLPPPPSRRHSLSAAAIG